MKSSKWQDKLLNMLSGEQYVTAKELAAAMEVSEKTVRNYIAELNDTMQGGQIESKHGSGYRVVLQSGTALPGKQLPAAVSNIPETNEERVDYIICELLLDNTEGCGENSVYTDPFDLGEELCISESTLANCMRLAKETLQEYSLKIVTHRKKGVRVEGDEFDIRICMSDYLERGWNLQRLEYEKLLREKKIVAGVLLDALTGHGVTAPESSINKLINHIYITIYRNKGGNYIHFTAAEHKDINNFDSTAITVAKETCDALEKTFAVKFTEDDYDYIAIYMVGQRMKREQGKGEYNFVIPSEMQELVTKILKFLYDTMRVDFRDNFTVMMNLIVHMVSLSIRLNYNLKIDNPLLADIKSQYSFGYAVACQAATVIEKKYGKKLSEDEIGYLGIIFEEAHQRQAEGRVRSQRKNIAIVCATGRAGAQLLARQYQRLFGEYLESIAVCNAHELRNLDFTKIDYVISTAHVDVNIPVPILETKLMLSMEDIYRLQKTFEQGGSNQLLKYYSPSLFFPVLELEKKEDVLRFLCTEAAKQREVPDQFFESVLKRESMGTTDIGEMVAIPHPFGRVTCSTFACVATLAKPVFWGNRAVSIVILITVASDEPGDMEAFFEPTSEFMMAPEKGQSLLRTPTFNHFMDLLQG